MKRIALASISFLLIFSQCKFPTDAPQESITIAALHISPLPDTLFMASNGETRAFHLTATSVNRSEKTIRNDGTITRTSFTVTQIDTVSQAFDVSRATWYTSDPAILSISQGTAIARSPGLVNVHASFAGVNSEEVLVLVRMADVAPGLSLDPPDVVFTLENKVMVSGNVQKGAILKVEESNSGFAATNVAYDADGHFSVQVTGLNPGFRAITATATHPTRSDLFTRRSKYVYYYSPWSAEADSITGIWTGHIRDYNFQFVVSRSSIPTRYDINGVVDIQFAGYGTIQNVQLVGIVNNDGTMDVSGSQSQDGFSVSGSLKGKFKTTGTAQGTIAATAKKAGWPDLGFQENWTAEKK